MGRPPPSGTAPHKRQHLRPARPHGGILILALLCSGLAVLALSHWVLTITARSRQVDTLEDVTKRRIARNNGRQLGFRHLQRNVLPASSGTGASATAPLACIAINHFSARCTVASCSAELPPRA